ncbi:MBL fold hydrolase [Brevibacillus reuszeri]|uniref:MBL fold hydrolase n=1 Tax=Brevibacillus reuszeri TaxID=54915 RepID=A0A0K9YXX9_9BACL|nr:MBL fold metallo-hydrolase [Brevibacillus reuszeri]KNB73516.1 metal-dependent hydrolase [Brevibacillus reuszeri]MED1858692.1 MBL fold metallo-hydrolase [Brevibacillus reuszeri]GED69672.1 MBL fold hydrolase [Brevibacillus reuszeri]
MNTVHLLEIEFEHNGQKQIITPVLLHDEQHTILIDCGYPDFLPLLEKAAQKHGISLQSLTAVIVTHHDMDHIGSLAALKRTYPQIEIIAYESEVPYLAGSKKSLRIEQAEATLDNLSPEEKPHAEAFIRFLETIEPAHVDRTVTHQEQLPWCGGIEIIHTPGHMPGHISLYLPASKTMITGDAVVASSGKLEIANPQFTMDLAAAIRSVQLLLDYDIQQLICYHGGLFAGDARPALQQVIHMYTTDEQSEK